MPAMDLIVHCIVMKLQHLILYVVVESLIFFIIIIFQFLRIYPQWYCTFYPSHYFRREACLLSKSLFLINFCAPFSIGFLTCSYWQLTENSSICVLCLFRLKQGSILQMWLKLHTFMNQSILQVPSALKWFPENKHRVTIPHISIAVPQTHLSCWQINASFTVAYILGFLHMFL